MPTTPPKPLARKNIVILHADQMRADALGCMGNPFARTPAIDGIAAEGTVCTRHIVANPVCMPSRASLLTGLYPAAHGVWCNGVALQRREYLPTTAAPSDSVFPVGVERVTLADALAGAGYDTAAFGKLHLTPSLAPSSYGFPETGSRWTDGSMNTWRGPYYGFRHVELTHSHGDNVCDLGPYAAWLTAHDPGLRALVKANQTSATRPVTGVSDCFASALPSSLHHSTWLGERACAYIERERPTDRPFFLWVGFPDPHHPFTPPADLISAFEGAAVAEFHDPAGVGYPPGHPALHLLPDSLAAVPLEQRRIIVRYTYALVHLIDRAIGRIRASLARAGLEQSTIIAITSDHGDYLGDHGLMRKTVLGCAPLARVPFVLRAPGCGLPTRIDAPMSNVDVMPTLLDYAGVTPPPGMQGQPLAHILSAPSHHRAFVQCATGIPASRNLTVYDDTHRLSWFPDSDFVELYRHDDDPGEMRDLARTPGAAALVARLRHELAEGVSRSWEPSFARISRW